MAGDSVQTLEGNGKLSSAAVFCELMNLINDDISYILQMALHHFSGKNRLKGFRCCNEDVWRVRRLLPAIRLSRIAMADGGGQLCRRDETLDPVDHVPVEGT